MNELAVYRPRRVRAFFVIGVGCVFCVLAASWWGPAPIRDGGFLLFGIIAIAIGCGTLATRTIVTHTGIRKLPVWLTRFEVSWPDVEGWVVVPYGPQHAALHRRLWPRLFWDAPIPNELSDTEGDSFTFRAVVIKVRGCSKAAMVTDAEASRPSFDEFIDAIRSYAADKEIYT